MNKYRLTDKKKIISEHVLYRIEALTDFSDVKKGDLGGWIESESNLSQKDNAWVSDDACVYGNAQVYDNARVCDNAIILKNADISEYYHVYCTGNIGSRQDKTTFFLQKDGTIGVNCGCFTGSLEEFLKKVEKTHGNNKHAQVYRLETEIAKIQILEDEEE